MPGFSFKLQPFLNFKTQIEKNRKYEFGKAVMLHEQEKEILNAKELEMDQNVNSIVEFANQGVPVYVLKNYSEYISKLKNDIYSQVENVKKAEERVDICRDKLSKALQERKVMENLKNKQLEEYAKEQIKEEQKIIDEVVSYKFSVVGD